MIGTIASLLAAGAPGLLALQISSFLAFLVTIILAASAGGFTWTALCYYLIQPSERQRRAWPARALALAALTAVMSIVQIERGVPLFDQSFLV